MFARTRRALALFLTLAVGLVALAQPATAQDGNQGDLELALSGLFFEIALLYELDAFAGSNITEIAEIHFAYAPWPAVPRDRIVDLLFAVDDDLATTKNAMSRVLGPMPQVSEALDELSIARRSEIVSGVVGSVPTGPYRQALGALLSSGTTNELMRRGVLGVEMMAELDPALDDLVDPQDLEELTPQNSTPNPARSGSNGFPWVLIAAIAGGAVLVAGFVLRRHRGINRVDAAAEHVADEVLQAHRQLAGVVDEDAIADIGCGAAVVLTGAHDAMIFRRVTDGLRRIGETGVIITSVLDRVIETAQPLLTIVDDDPAIGGPVRHLWRSARH